ncbi:MAG: ammonium transporter, partial [Janthinobacterium lividum]
MRKTNGSTARATLSRWGLAAGVVAMLTLASHPVLAQTPGGAVAGQVPAGTVDKGDVAWMLTSTLLVLMMSVPGLAL